MLKNKTMFFNETITRWDEGIPLGNGDIGTLMWGNSNAFRLSLDKGDIWDTTKLFDIGEKFSYDHLKQLVHDNDEKTMRKIYDEPYLHAAPTKLPAGKIIVDFKCDENVQSSLDFMTAQATVTIGKFVMNAFVSATDKVGMATINSGDVTIKLQNPIYGNKKEKSVVKKIKQKFVKANSPLKLFYDAPIIVHGNVDLNNEKISMHSYEQIISNEFSYFVVLGVLENGLKTEFAYTVSTSKDGVNFKAEAEKSVVDALSNGYSEMLDRHKKWWKDYFSSSSISIPDKFIENQWYLDNYLLGSCSRKNRFPMPIQGLWTADDDKALPPWKGDYHADLNMQLCYYSYLKAGHIDAGECLIDYLFSLSEKAREFAKEFYGGNGMCLPSVMDIEGKPLGGWAMYSLSPTNQLWLCNTVARHFNTTADVDSIKNKAYPYLKEHAEFILSIMNEDSDGFLVLPLSSSPEIHDNTIKSWLKPNSNYDQAIILSLFDMLVQWADMLGYSDDTLKWKNVLSHLDDLKINSDNELLLNIDENLMESHRHHSHAMAIHPLRQLDYDKENDKKVIDATISRLEKLGTKHWVGFSFAWMAELYVVQKRGDKAYDILTKFYKYFCLPNGFHINGDYTKQGFSALSYRPFTLEGNFCATDAIQEMLLFSEKNTVEVFRAVPAEWKDICFDNFHGDNGIIVSSKMQDGVLNYIKIKSTQRNVCLNVKNKFTSDFQCNCDYEIKGNIIAVTVVQNEEIILKKREN